MSKTTMILVPYAFVTITSLFGALLIADALATLPDPLPPGDEAGTGEVIELAVAEAAPAVQPPGKQAVEPATPAEPPRAVVAETAPPAPTPVDNPPPAAPEPRAVAETKAAPPRAMTRAATPPPEPAAAAKTSPVALAAGQPVRAQDAFEPEAAAPPPLSRDAVVDVVRRKKGQVKSCYERELKTDPDLRGMVQVAWTISSAGSVRDVQIVANSTGNPDMESCIARTIGSWNFPENAGTGVDIEYPFRFSPTL